MIGVCAALAIGFYGVPVHGRFISMPTSARTWLDIRDKSGVEIDANGFPIADNVGQFFASENAIPFAEYDSILPLMAGNRTPALHVFAEGSADGNALKSFVSGEGTYSVSPSIQSFNSMHDTYTLNGPAGLVGQSVTFDVHFDVDGTASIFGSIAPVHIRLGSVGVTAKIGTFNPTLVEFNREDLRVSPFDATSSATFLLDRYVDVASVSGDIDLHLTRTITAVVGTPFDLAFGLNIIAADAFSKLGETNGFTVDLLHTARIDFDVPTGYSLTSVLGWTPDAAVTPTPEPSTFVLAGIGALCLVLAARRRA